MFEQPSYLGVGTADWVAALKSSDPLERRLAAHALAEIGATAREAVPALTEALRDSVSFVRVWAAAALARVETGKRLRHSRSARGDARWDVRSLAAWHLGRLGPRHPGIEAAVPELRELLNDNDPSARAEALAALGNLAGKGAPPAELKVSLGPGVGSLSRSARAFRAYEDTWRVVVRVIDVQWFVHFEIANVSQEVG
jgi:HEAT repeats/PBS lyase HEAT-like repeat